MTRVVSPRLGVHLTRLVGLGLMVFGLGSVLTITAVLAASDQNKRAEGLPLEADTWVQFSVEQATWLSLDVAPDGQQLVIEVLGDLYLLPIAGGKAQSLTQGMAFDSQPRFSPDGSQIVFLSDRDGSEEVWLFDMDKQTTRQLTTTDDRIEMVSPAWSPDGQSVIVSQGSYDVGTYELWAYPLAGGTGVQITRAKAAADTPRGDRHNALGAAFDPSGRYLYYARKSGGFGYNLKLPQWQIARRDLQTQREDVITQAVGSAMRPLLSPDGRFLVYGTRYEQQSGLRIRDLRSGDDHWLAYPIQRDEQESRFSRDLLPGYAFSPDGKSLYTTPNGKIIRVTLADRSIVEIPFVVDINKGISQRLDFPYRVGLGPVKARVLGQPQLSPDGKKLAFSAFSQIYVYDFARDKATALTAKGEIAAYPSWSPNGKDLAYVSWSDLGGHIYRMRARAGASPKRLTRGAAYYQSPVWTADGQRIVALRASTQERLNALGRSGPGVGADLVWLQASGGDLNIVMPSRGYGRPHFGPETDRIYLQTIGRPVPGATRAGLVSVRFDGSDLRDVLAVSGPGLYNQDDDVGAESSHISPDGRYVLFRQANQLYLVRLLPYLPGQTVKLSKPQLPLVKLTDVGADALGWADDGQSVYWSVGNRLYQRELASIEFAADSKAKSPAVEQQNQIQQEELAEQHAAVRYVDVDVYMPRYVPQSAAVVLDNATLLTMADNQELSAGVVPQGRVVVQGDRIVAVGSGSDVPIPENARVFDLQGKFVLPGYVDTHAHYRVAREVPGTSNPAFLANLAYGVTTGMDVQPSTVDILAAQDLVDAGLAIGPRAFSTGPGVFRNNNFRSQAHATAVLRRYKEHYQVNNIKAYVSGSRKQRQWLIQASKALNLMPTTEGYLDMKVDLTHVIDGFSGLEHNFPLPVLYDDVVQLTARSRIAYTPTLLVTYGGPWAENQFYTQASPHDDIKLRRFTPYTELARRTLRRDWFHPREYIYPTVAASSRKIVEAGGQVGVGAHGQLQGLGYHWELWSLASGGYENLQALALATVGGARMLGMSADLGSIESGKLADLVVLDLSPLEDIRNSQALHLVMKGGVIYEAATLDQIWPRQESLPSQWWWSDGPELQQGTP